MIFPFMIVILTDAGTIPTNSQDDDYSTTLANSYDLLNSIPVMISLAFSVGAAGISICIHGCGQYFITLLIFFSSCSN